MTRYGLVTFLNRACRVYHQSKEPKKKLFFISFVRLIDILYTDWRRKIDWTTAHKLGNWSVFRYAGTRIIHECGSATVACVKGIITNCSYVTDSNPAKHAYQILMHRSSHGHGLPLGVYYGIAMMSTHKARSTICGLEPQAYS